MKCPKILKFIFYSSKSYNLTNQKLILASVCQNSPKSATRIPKQFMSLLSVCCIGIGAALESVPAVSCGRLRATAIPIGTVLSINKEPKIAS